MGNFYISFINSDIKTCQFFEKNFLILSNFIVLTDLEQLNILYLAISMNSFTILSVYTFVE